MRHALRRAVAVSAIGGGCYGLSVCSARRRESAADATVPVLSAALPTVAKFGFAIVEDVVPRAMLERSKDTDAFRSMPTTASTGSTDLWRLSALGRFHRIRFDVEDADAFQEMEALWLPLVDKFFSSTGSEDAIYRSELQLLTATPFISDDQMWHSDNQARGITIIVPLCDFTAENGATQLLPGTHELRSSWPLLWRDGARVATPRQGSIVVYDARTYHRGLGNSTKASRPALVFRYDRKESPPPGVGVVASLAHASAAKVLHTSMAVVLATREAVRALSESYRT